MESRTSVIDLYKLPRQQLAEHGVTPITSISELWMSPLFTKYAESIAGVPVDLKTVAAKLPKDFPRLDAPAIDVLAYVVSLWLERHQATGEASSTIKFASVDAIRTMGWSYDGPSKKRFERALKKLADIRYEVFFHTKPRPVADSANREEVEDVWRKVTLFPTVHVAHRYVRSSGGTVVKRGRRPRSLGHDVRVVFSDDFAWFASRGTFKLVHPYLYASVGRWGKQLFALITSVASKRNDWVFPEQALRAHFGAPASKLYWSQLMRRLERHLERMKQDGVLQSWETGSAGDTVRIEGDVRAMRTMREPYLRVRPNRADYFYSRRDPRTFGEREVKPGSTTPAEVPESGSEDCIKKMLKLGFSDESAARALVRRHGLSHVETATDQLEFAMKRTEVRNPGGYLRGLIDGKVPPHPKWKSKSDRARIRKENEMNVAHSDHCHKADRALREGDLELARTHLAAAEALFTSERSHRLLGDLSDAASRGG